MKRFGITVQLFVRTLSIIIPYTLMLLSINIVLFQVTKAFAEAAKDPEQLSDALYFFGDIDIVGFFLYLFFLFIGYEYMRKVRGSNMDEVLSAHGAAGVSVYIRQYVVLVLAVVLVSANISVYMIWGWKNLVCAEELLGEVVRMLFVNVFLLSLGAVSLGTVLSKIRNRLAGYAVIVGILFLILPNAASFYTSLQREYHIPVFFIRDLIDFTVPDLLADPNTLYGFPLESYRMAAMGFWITCAALVLTHKALKERRLVREAVTVCLCALMAFFIYRTESKGSVLLMSDHPESAEEYWYYYGDYEGKSEQADFEVSKYELDVKLGRELEAEAWMTLDKQGNAKRYLFTLNHAYRVKRVTNQDGIALNYTRDQDYLCVEPGNQSVSKLYISYRGHSELFYANGKACFLPGFFAWYPKAGYHMTFENDNTPINSFLKYEEPKTQFVVRTNRQNMVSNLSQTDFGFSGEAETLTLINGYYHVVEEGGYRMISYPLMQSEDEGNRILIQELPSRCQALKEYLGIGEEIDLRIPENVFMVPRGLSFNSLVNGGVYRYKDYAIFSNNISANDVLEDEIGHRIPPEKKLLGDIFFLFDAGAELNPECLYRYKEKGDASGYEDDREELHDRFVDKIEEVGERNVFIKVFHYLLDDDDHTEPLTFLNSIGQEE